MVQLRSARHCTGGGSRNAKVKSGMSSQCHPPHTAAFHVEADMFWKNQGLHPQLRGVRLDRILSDARSCFVVLSCWLCP